MYAERPQYRQYQQHLVRLHRLIAANQGDSDEAMELREQMEGPERLLSGAEMQRLNELSGDLSMLHDREIPDGAVVAQTPATDVPRLLQEAYDRDWNQLLELLRTGVPFLQPDQIAYLRARAYRQLNEMVPAIAFLDEAIRRNPKLPNYHALAMELLYKDQQLDEAYARARTYLADPAAPGRVVIVSSGVLSRLAQQAHPPADLAASVQVALSRLPQAIRSESLPYVRAAGWVSLGLLAQFVHNEAIAAKAIQGVLDEIEDDAHVQSRGLLLRSLELIQQGKSQTPESRNLSRELADAFAIAS